LPIQLSLRLQTLADFVPDGSSIADVGTDHAYIPIFLVQTDRVKKAIATDVAEGPIRAAQVNVQANHLEDRISVRHADGLAKVTPGEVDTVIIAGMGGHTEAEILKAAPAVVNQVSRLILQPMNASYQVRNYLQKAGFHLSAERVIEEDGRIYEIVVADKPVQTGPDPAYDPYRKSDSLLEFACEFGPTLLSEPTPVFCRLVEQTLNQWQGIIKQLSISESEQAKARYAELSRKIEVASDWLRRVS